MGNRAVLLLTVVAAVLLACSGVVLAQQTSPDRGQQRAEGVIPDRYIVALEESAPDARQVAEDHAQRYRAEVSHVYRHALKGYAARVPAERLEDLRNDPNVRAVTEDREVQAFAQKADNGLKRIGGSEKNPDGTDSNTQTLSNDGDNVDVAVLDTGIHLAHADLKANTSNGKTCIRGTKNANDDNGHGSHVAGTIGAIDNTDGVVGVAPKAKLWAVKVLNRYGSGSWASVICGVDYVTGRNQGSISGGPIEVANMSLGGEGGEGSCTDGGLREAICRSVATGTTYVVAAGNSSEDASNYTPATYPEVITVSALADFNGEGGGGADPTCRSDVDDTLADFSNYGDDVDIAAPGVCVRSTYKNGGYATASGTSMASPHVAGAAALYKKSNPGATPEAVKSALQQEREQYPMPDDPDTSDEGVVDVSSL